MATSDEDIAKFARRLSEWSSTLPEEERALGELLVEQARSIRPHDVMSKEVKLELSVAARDIIKGINERWQVPEGWVEIGPIWEKKNKIELGEQIEITQQLFTRQIR